MLVSAGCGGSSGIPRPQRSAPSPSGAIPNYVPPNYPSSEWPEYRRDDQRTGSNPGQTLITKANVATLAPKWISTTPGGTFSNPVIVNGTVYKADLGGHIVALDEATGSVRWTFYEGAGSDSFIGTPAYSNGMLYDGSVQGNFYALNAATGAQIISSSALM